MPIDKILKTANANPAISGALGGAAGGALVSAFTNKKSARKLLKAGGLVALGGVAWSAYQKYQERGQATGEAIPEAAAPAALPATEAPAALPATPAPAAEMSEQAFVQQAAEENTASLILQAMVSAGYADGHLSESERSQIWQKALEEDLSSAALEDLQSMLAAPQPVEVLAAQADDMKTRIEVYTASRLAIDADCEAGAAHLEQLAAAMQMPPGLIAALNETAA